MLTPKPTWRLGLVGWSVAIGSRGEEVRRKRRVGEYPYGDHPDAKEAFAAYHGGGL